MVQPDTPDRALAHCLAFRFAFRGDCLPLRHLIKARVDATFSEVARRALSSNGMAIVKPFGATEYYLAIARNSSAAAITMFREFDEGRPSDCTSCRELLQALPGARKSHKVRFGLESKWAVLIPLKLITDDVNAGLVSP